MPACLWVWGFGFFLGFNDLEKEGILIWVWGVRKKGFLFQVLGVQKVGFLAWVWLCLGCWWLFFFFSSMCIAFAFAKSGNRSGGLRRQLLVEPWNFGHGSGVGGLG